MSQQFPSPDVNLGLVYQQLKDSYAAPEELVFRQIPEAIRKSDRKLTFRPLHRMLNEPFVLQIGPRVLALSMVKGSYSTWAEFYTEVKKVFTGVQDLGFVQKVERIGLRNINLFEDDVFDRFNLEIKFVDEDF